MIREARNQTGDREPERPQDPGEGATHQQRGGEPGDDGQHVIGEELGVLVGEADARGHATRAVDQLVLVELVAERDREQEQAGQDRQVDADRVSRRPARCATRRPGTGRRRDSRAATTSPLNRPWTSRRNGSSNRKNPMSRPKTGSLTALRRVRRERHRACPRGGPSPTPPTLTRRPRSRRTRATTVRATPASGVRSGRSPASKATVGGPPGTPRRSPNAEPGRPARASAAWAASLSRSNSPRSELVPPSAGGGAAGAASQRLSEQHDRARRTARRRTARASPSAGSRRRCRSRRSCTTARPSTGPARHRTGSRGQARRRRSPRARTDGRPVPRGHRTCHRRSGRPGHAAVADRSGAVDR